MFLVKTIWIGVDDTDSTTGGCTTYVARTIIQKLMTNYEIIGYPRLVRLNPNIPWKTRGNGALAVHVGKKGGAIKRTIGEINGKPVECSLTFTQELDTGEQQDVYTLVKETVETQSRIDDTNTNPGFVLLIQQPPAKVYTNTVRTIVHLQDIQHMLTTLQGRYEGYKNSRGLIGATAAIAWEPLDRTFELITYRPEHRWGTKRSVDSVSVQKMDSECPTTFDNYDRVHDHNRIVPSSPCPILYGIRGTDVEDLIRASALVTSEPVEGWMIFETNQGTDDHLQKKQIKDIQAFESVLIEGYVMEKPSTIQGGHVLFVLKDDTGSIPCAAYEPTKEFRAVIRQLHSGDHVIVYGGVREQPLTINLEKIQVKQLVKVLEKTENPVCPTCGKHMKSKGTDQGYKCLRCKTTSVNPTVQEKTRLIKPGFYEVPVCARRHLSKPLKRMNVDFPVLH
jgi:tRNA(Ile2)-agmatinylcytidine synthase